ncbi:right-handed parallel beta-helix repeat-containing protein [uncultured Tateyamaria sp.]|uniref:right-handed parallel beta-helix repeat-containing protein n=1 Tax=uncultured Tateyamaria sp. TaxID=455651 RepID=UPI0026216FF3|nr:right-handed parallel beta-helix repeat-containing protein [uncultured Tateyamaria sp.]
MAGSAAQQQIVVSTAQDLIKALDAATGGEQIVLAPGHYGKIELSPASLPTSGGQFDKAVHVASLDPGNMAVIEGLDIRGLSNLHFDNLSFAHIPETGDDKNDAIVQVRAHKGVESSAISISGSTFEGQPAATDIGGDPASVTDVATRGGLVQGNFGGIAVAVGEASDILLDGNEITGFYRGISLEDVTGVTLSKNHIHDLRSDGIVVGEVRNLVIEQNVIRDLDPWRHEDAPGHGDHPDLIQFWTTNSDAASTGIVIRDNVLIQSDAAGDTFAQGIFMRNPKAEQDPGSTDFFYSDVTIEGNVIYNSHINSLVVGETVGLTVANNILIQNVDEEIRHVTTPIIAIAERSQDVSVTGNIMPGLALTYSTISNMATLQEGRDSGWTVSTNAFTSLEGAGPDLSAVADGGTRINYAALDDQLETLKAETLARDTPPSDDGNQEDIPVETGILVTDILDSMGALIGREWRDLDDVKPWESKVEDIDAATGKTTASQTIWDNGLRDDRFFDNEGAMASHIITDDSEGAAWTSNARLYDPDGTLRQSEFIMADGERRTNSYTENGDLYSAKWVDEHDSERYSTKTTTYESDGSFTVTKLLDSGLETIRIYDVNGANRSKVLIDHNDEFDWTARGLGYDPSGKEIFETTLDDEGSLEQHLFNGPSNAPSVILYDDDALERYIPWAINLDPI